MDGSGHPPQLRARLENSRGTSSFNGAGLGLSEQVPYVPTLEQQADDVIAVMDAVGVRRATLVAWFTTCGAMALVAARAPERVDNLVLIDPLAQGPEAPGELHGWTHTETQKRAEILRHWSPDGDLEY